MKYESIIVSEQHEERFNAPHILPIYATSSFQFDSLEQAQAIFTKEQTGHSYSRYGNPTLDTTAQKLAALEVYGSDISAKAYLTSSGMSAISTLMWAIVPVGGTIITQKDLYGGTTELFRKVLAIRGIEVVELDMQDLDVVEDAFKHKNGAVLYVETPANPTMVCYDLKKLAALAHQYQAKLVVDNTFCTMYLQQPLLCGADFVVYSTTKFINGHGNSIAGAIIGKDIDFMKTKVWETLKLTGSNCSPFDAWLTYTGMKTLAVRMNQQCSNAVQVATFLEKNEQVARVNYPGLTSHPDHQLATEQMRQYGAMLSFELKAGMEAGLRFMKQIKLCTLAPTLGDVDTLVLHPASSSHLNIPKAQREKVGITDGLVRMSIGLEHIDDLLDDLEHGLLG